MLAAIPLSTIVLTLVADGVGLLDFDRTWLAGLVLVLGSAPWLWTTRFVRHPALVYLGLAQFVAGTLDLASCAAGWNNTALLAGWLAVTTACLGLTLWAAGTGTRRLKLSDFYTEPCFHTACFLMIGAYVVALQARGLGREAYPLAASSLGVNVLVTMLLARTWRRAELTYFAVFQFVTATYLVLFSVGKNDPRMAYVLGLAAVSRGDRALGDRVRMPTSARRVDEGMCPTAFSLGRSLDRRRRFAQRPVIGCARPGGCIVPLDGQEPSRRRTGSMARSPPCSPRATSDGSAKCRASS